MSVKKFFVRANWYLFSVMLLTTLSLVGPARAASAGSDPACKVPLSWSGLSQDAKAEILEPYTELPADIKAIDLADLSAAERAQLSPEIQAYYQKAVDFFNREVSREEIEQSEFALDGDEKLAEAWMIVSDCGRPLGMRLSFMQHGLDENGESADINWSASVRFGEDGEALKDASGEIYDDLYFEWSGH